MVCRSVKGKSLCRSRFVVGCESVPKNSDAIRPMELFFGPTIFGRPEGFFYISR